MIKIFNIDIQNRKINKIIKLKFDFYTVQIAYIVYDNSRH